MLALLFMHIRLTMPWLFYRILRALLAAGRSRHCLPGVTVSELLRRRGVLVLAHPLERTGVFCHFCP